MGELRHPLYRLFAPGGVVSHADETVEKWNLRNGVAPVIGISSFAVAGYLLILDQRGSWRW